MFKYKFDYETNKDSILTFPKKIFKKFKNLASFLQKPASKIKSGLEKEE